MEEPVQPNLSPEEAESIIRQVEKPMRDKGIKSAIVRYGRDIGRVFAMEPTDTYNPEKPEARPQFTMDERYDPMQPFMVIPRLRELANWMVFPDKSTNIFLFNNDGLVQNLVAQYQAIIVGDGAKITVYEEDLKAEDEELTRACRDWSKHAGGKGRSLDSYVIPWWIVDNVTTGYSVMAKYIGKKDDDMVDENDLALIHIDPRLYAPVGHDDRLWRKIIVYPIRQMLLPETKDRFDAWVPSFRGPYAPFSSAGMTVYEKPVQLPANAYYDCTLFLGIAPVSAIASEMISTLEMRFYRNKAYEKCAFPIVLIRVSRSTERDANDEKFIAKLNSASKMGAEIRNGDSIAIEGKEYDSDGRILSEGWEISTLDVKSQMLDFAQAFRLIDEQKAYGLRTSMAMLTSSGIEGQKHTMSTGANINANVGMTAKSIRTYIRDKLVTVLSDYIFWKYGKVIKDEQIDIQFSEIRETDVSAYSGVIFQAFDRSLITYSEARQHLRKVGLNIEYKGDEEMMEEAQKRQMMAQGGANPEMQGEEPNEQEPMEGEEGEEGSPKQKSPLPEGMDEKDRDYYDLLKYITGTYKDEE